MFDTLREKQNALLNSLKGAVEVMSVHSLEPKQ